MALINGLRYCSVLLLTGMLFGCDNGDFYFKVKESQMHRDYISKHYMDEDEGYELKEVPEDFFRELPIDYDITLYAKNGKLVHNKIWESQGSESKVIIPIKYGKAHGKCLSFNWNKNEYDFNNNNYTGDYKIKLTLASEYTYRLGVLHGKYKEYYDDGQIKLEGQYNNGFQIGKEIFYSDGGRVLSSIEYVSGKMKDAKTYFENGRLKRHTKYIEGDETWFQQYNYYGKLMHECVGSWRNGIRSKFYHTMYDPKSKRYCTAVFGGLRHAFDNDFYYYNEDGEFVCTIKNAIKPGDREIIEFSNGTVLSFIPTRDYDTEAKDPMLELPRGKFTYRFSTQEIQCFENRRLVGTYNLKSKQVNGTIQLAGLLKPITSWQTLYGNHQENGLWDYCKEINNINRIKQQAGLDRIYFESLEEFSKKIPKAVY